MLLDPEGPAEGPLDGVLFERGDEPGELLEGAPGNPKRDSLGQTPSPLVNTFGSDTAHVAV